MSNKSKTKGNKFELDISKYLTKNFGENFTRVPNSGAFIGGKNQVRKDVLTANQIRLFKGDIIPPDSLPNLIIECKHYAEFPFHKLIGNNKIALLDEWISEVEYDACDDDDFWLLIWKISRHGTYVLWNNLEFNYKLDLDLDLPVGNHITYRGYYIEEIDPFFSKYSDVIRNISKKRLDNAL